MAREVTPPPMVARSRDLPMIITVLVALAGVVLGMILTIYTDHKTAGLMFFALAALGVLAAAMRLYKERSVVSTGDLAGEDNSEE